ncbi:MAG: hypothetical protein WAU28_02170 [Candidatus Moraniibacteriota bacterium]
MAQEKNTFYKNQSQTKKDSEKPQTAVAPPAGGTTARAHRTVLYFNGHSAFGAVCPLK